MKRHLFRIIASVIVFGGFILALAYTESYLWIGLECMGAALLSGIIICIDSAHEYPDEFEE